TNASSPFTPGAKRWRTVLLLDVGPAAGAAGAGAGAAPGAPPRPPPPRPPENVKSTEIHFSGLVNSALGTAPLRRALTAAPNSFTYHAWPVMVSACAPTK